MWKTIRVFRFVWERFVLSKGEEKHEEKKSKNYIVHGGAGSGAVDRCCMYIHLPQ